MKPKTSRIIRATIFAALMAIPPFVVLNVYANAAHNLANINNPKDDTYDEDVFMRLCREKGLDRASCIRASEQACTTDTDCEERTGIPVSEAMGNI